MDGAAKWRQGHPEIVAKYSGKQIAIHPERGIVAAGDNFGEVYTIVKEMGLLDDVVFDSVTRGLVTDGDSK